MIYNPKDEISRSQAITRFKYLLDQGKKFELKEVRKKRSLSQNSYLHLILTYFGLETGYTLEQVKRNFFKLECNKELFLDSQNGKLGSVQYLKSSADLDTKEMTIAIERFKNWSAEQAGILLPDAEDRNFIEHIQNEAEKYQNRIFH